MDLCWTSGWTMNEFWSPQITSKQSVIGIKEKQVLKCYIAIHFCNISKKKHRQKRWKTTALIFFTMMMIMMMSYCLLLNAKHKSGSKNRPWPWTYYSHPVPHTINLLLNLVFKLFNFHSIGRILCYIRLTIEMPALAGLVTNSLSFHLNIKIYFKSHCVCHSGYIYLATEKG